MTKNENDMTKRDPWRLEYHLMPEKGWLNDPNGANQFQGIYHIYHQYVPEDANGGATHWGHKTSSDMVYFKEEEIFLSPDQVYDKDGVYSGSAIQHENQLHFFYTGNLKKEGAYDYLYEGREQSVVHVVSSDGFDVLEREIVIDAKDFPKELTTHVRDPKVFKQKDTFYMLLGARSIENIGVILVYSSKNLEEWHYQGYFLEGEKEGGYMWECPDYFELNGHDILLMSPQGLLPEKYENPHIAGYLVGEVDWEKLKFQPEEDFQELDYGFDFYAPQTFEDESGRRILWAWMGVGDTAPEYINPTLANNWQHALTLPRELFFEDNKLKQRPLPEYQKIRKELIKDEFISTEKYAIKRLTTEVYETSISFNEPSHYFELGLREDTTLIFKEGTLSLEHGPSGYGRRWRSIELEEVKDLQIFSDKSSLEIFINNGEYVMTSRVYPREDINHFTLVADERGRLKIWALEKTIDFN